MRCFGFLRCGCGSRQCLETELEPVSDSIPQYRTSWLRFGLAVHNSPDADPAFGAGAVMHDLMLLSRTTDFCGVFVVCPLPLFEVEETCV